MSEILQRTITQRLKRAEEILDDLIEKRSQPQSFEDVVISSIMRREFVAAKRHLENGDFNAAIRCLESAKKWIW